MKAISILRSEHRSISAVLHALKELARMAQDATVRPRFQVFRSILRYIDEREMIEGAPGLGRRDAELAGDSRGIPPPVLDMHACDEELQFVERSDVVRDKGGDQRGNLVHAALAVYFAGSTARAQRSADCG